MTFLQRASVLLISLSLAACGGGGSAGTGDASLGNGDHGSTAPTKNQLFVGDSNQLAFAALTTLKPATGTLPAKVLDIGQLVMWLGIAYHLKQDRLYANDTRTISVFDNASLLNGRIAPTRSITPLIPGLQLLHGMQLDMDKNVLYVGYTTGNGYSVAVFEGISALTGSVAPKRVITGVSADDFVVDTVQNILYTRNRGIADAKVYAYPEQSKINGAASFITRKTLSLPLPNVTGLALDTAHDRLYFGVLRNGANGGGVGVVDLASTRGTPDAQGIDHTPASLIALPNGAAHDIGLAYDPSNDRLYAGLENNVYILDAASKMQAGTPTNAVLVTAPAGSAITTFAF